MNSDISDGEIKDIEDELIAKYESPKRLDLPKNQNHLFFSVKSNHDNIEGGQHQNMQFREIRACCKSYFEHDEQMIHPESMYIDYKLYNWPIVHPLITRKLAIEILSFLNCNGGALLIGISDQDYKVKGIQLTPKNREEFQKYSLFYCKINEIKLDDKILGYIHPLIKNEIEVTFLPIMKAGNWKKHLYVVRILVQQGKTNELYTFSQETNEMISSVRRQSSCCLLKQDQIKTEIQTRIQYPNYIKETHFCVQVKTRERDVSDQFMFLYSIQASNEGLEESCRLSELEKNQQISMDNNGSISSNNSNELLNDDDSSRCIILQFIQNNESVNLVGKAIEQELYNKSIEFRRKNQYKQLQFQIKRKHISHVKEVLSSLGDVFQQAHQSLLRVIFKKQRIFQVEVPAQKVIIFSSIDRAKLQQLKQFLQSEIQDIYILPLEYSLMVQVDDLKEGFNFLNRKRRVLAHYSFKNVDVRYGISDNLKITISNLLEDKLPSFSEYFDQISSGIGCKGEDNDDKIILYFDTFIDLILASERLHFLMYNDPSFRQFGKNQKIYIHIEIFTK